MRIIEEIFNLIAKTGELTLEIGKMYAEERKLSRSSYYGSLYRLENRGLIEKRYQQKQNNRKRKAVVYKLTEKGKKYYVPKRILKILRNDGLSTVVIFDIPETFSRQRTIFRRFLIRNGFTQLQKSVLISPHKLSADTIELAEELKIRPYLTVLSSKVMHF